MQLFQELQRRNVFRVSIGYIVSSWLLVQVADLVLENIGAPDWVMQTIMLVLALGFPVVVFFSWAYEVTPEGIKLESEVDRSQSITHVTGRKLDRAIVAVLVIALAYFAYDKFVLGPQREAKLVEGMQQVATEQAKIESEVTAEPDKSIVVLPFVNMSSDAEQEYFSDGISEELLNLLAKIPQLRVISRTSAFSFKGKDIGISEIAEQLDVAHILEGSVRKAGNRVRITAQLIEARSDTHLWSETYERQLNDIFAIQDEIAAEVIDQLKITLLGVAPKTQEVDPEAYTLYLQARYLHRGYGGNNEKIVELYKQALTIDPFLTDAWHGLARIYGSQINLGNLPPEQGFALMSEAADKMLTFDPESGKAQDILGLVAMDRDSDLLKSATNLQFALESDPTNEIFIRHAAFLLARLNRMDKSLALTRELAARDPVNSSLHFNLGLTYYRAHRCDESIDSLRTVLKLSPESLRTHFYIGICLLFKGEALAALEEMAKEKHEERRILGMALINHSLGRPEKYQASLTELIERWGAEEPRDVARVYAFAEDKDNAFRWLDRAVESESPGLNRLPLYPLLQNLHSDPRWALFLARIGSSPDQLDAIEFEVTRPK